MKSTLSRRGFLKSVIAGSTLVYLSSPWDVVAQNNRDDLSVEELATKYFTSLSSDPELALWLRSYRKLNFKQIELFNEIIAAQALDIAVKNKERESQAKNKIFKSMRHAVNTLSMKQYGVPLNQIDSIQLNSLISEVWQKEYKQAAQELDVITAASCACYTYPNSTDPGGSAWASPNGIAGSTIRAGGSPNCGDCDYDVGYPANRRFIKYCNPGAYGYYTQQGGRFIYRNTSTNTRVLYGNTSVIFWIGFTTTTLEQSFRLD